MTLAASLYFSPETFAVSNGRCRGRNGQVCGLVGDIVVVLFSVSARSDHIGADILVISISAADSNIQDILCIAVRQTGDGPGQCRIGFAVYLALVFCGYSRACPVNRQLAKIIGDCVVSQRLFDDFRGNGVFISIFARRAAHSV